MNFLPVYEPSESESDKDDELYIEKMKEVKRRTSRGFFRYKRSIEKM